jgi:TetR/AcrR family tetracycline transcriptional repressor
MSVRQKRLSQEQIVEAALRCVDEEGLENLSMRRLGSALGVEAMSLYNYFRNKAEILDAIHQQLLAEMPVPGGQGSWEEQVRGAAMAFRGVLQAHPKAIPLMATRAAVRPGSLAYFDRGVAVFQRAGLTPDDSVRAFQSVFAMVVGHASFHFFRQGENPDDSHAHYVDYPALSRVTQFDALSEFEFGLEMLITGVQLSLRTPRPAR